MLNRTNRTLSANTNRLNLGTRMLGLNAGVNNGSLTLRTAQIFPTVTVRAEILEYPAIQEAAPPIKAMPKPAKPAMSMRPSSFPGLIGSARNSTAWNQGQTVLLSQPNPVVDVPTGVNVRVRGVNPLDPSRQSHSRSTLGWHCDRASRAGRSARAVLALVAGISPIT